jgi:hypothetical protein
VSPNLFRLLGDAIVVAHVGFVLFVVFGGLLVLRWPRLAWLHIPAAGWAAVVEFADWICPLTPLENMLRERAGLTTYHGDFIERYVLPLLYPEHLTRATQIALGSAVLVLNVIVYWLLVRRRCSAVCRMSHHPSP